MHGLKKYISSVIENLIKIVCHFRNAMADVI